MNQIIAIDGPSGAGKSTVSRILSKRLGFLYLDTGAMYRAVALQAKRNGIDTGQGKELNEICRNLDLTIASEGEIPGLYLGREDISALIRSPEMDMLSSKISAVREVREAMTELQRRMGAAGRVVAEGRDVGTVVFPDADHKFFITAPSEVRAARRYLERLGRGELVSIEEVEMELRKRDSQDSTRSIAPLCPAADATLIDTAELGIEQVVERILEVIEGRTITEVSS